MADPVETAPPEPERPGPGKRRRRKTRGADAAERPPRFSTRSRYSLFVSTMKVVLPALAVAIILLVLAWPRLVPDESQFRIGVSDLSPDAADNLSMINPRFQGRDSHDRPFSIVARKATQIDGGRRRITLDAPKADITLADGAWVALTADSGIYDRKAESLDLSGNVSLFHDRGFEMHTARAHINLRAGSARSDSPVSGHGPAGRLNAQGFRLREEGQTIVFTGHSELTLYPADGDGGARP